MLAQASGDLPFPFGARWPLPRGCPRALSFRMVKEGAGGGKVNQRAARKARLAAALRENLKRRKQQARERELARQRASNEASPARDAQVTGRVPDFRRNRSDE